MDRSPRRLFLMISLIAPLLAGCAQAGKVAVPAGGLRVLASETFLGDIAQNVAGTRVHVETLLPVMVSPHEFQPTPQDAIKIAQSQVLIVNGLGYESWLAKTLQESGGKRLVLVASDGLTANPDPSGEHPDGNPHMWMNPLNVVRYAENIRDGLSKADPAGADVYAANAKVYSAKLTDLDGWIKTEAQRVPPAKRVLVTNHDALGYFCGAYGFKVAGAVIKSVTSEASPSAKEMADLITIIKSSGAPAIFLDVSENQKLVRQIAEESGAKVVTDLYVETLSAADGPAPTYIEMLKHDVTIIVEALR